MLQKFPSMEELNGNPLFEGTLFLLYVIGSKEVFEEPAKNLKRLLHFSPIRYLVVFSAAFVGTKNIKLSGILTLGYVVIMDFLLNPNSGVSLIGRPTQDSEQPDDEFVRPVHTQLQPNQAPQPVPTNVAPPEPADRLNKFFQPLSMELEPSSSWP